MRGYAILIGAMKAGTTALYQGLCAHPRLAACATKEPEWWVRPELRERGPQAYAALWERTRGPETAWCLEASTAYTKLPVHPSAAPHLLGLGTELRFVYVVRNPLQRLRSQYVHALAEGWREGTLLDRLDPEALWFGNYRMQLAPYVECFEKESILVLSYEELASEPNRALARVCRFLEIEPLRMERLPHANLGEVHRTKRFLRLLRRRVGIDEHELEELEDLPYRHLFRSLRDGADAGLVAVLDELAARLERETEPNTLVSDAVHAALDEDLARFAEEWGLDPWTGRRLAPALV